MARQIVHNHHFTIGQGRCQLGFDIGFEDQSVHRCINDPWCGERVASQTGNEGLGLPVAEGYVIVKPLSYWCPAGALRQLGVCRRFINENKAMHIPAHKGCASVNPQGAGLANINAFLLAGDQCFFYC